MQNNGRKRLKQRMLSLKNNVDGPVKEPVCQWCIQVRFYIFWKAVVEGGNWLGKLLFKTVEVSYVSSMMFLVRYISDLANDHGCLPYIATFYLVPTLPSTCWCLDPGEHCSGPLPTRTSTVIMFLKYNIFQGYLGYPELCLPELGCIFTNQNYHKSIKIKLTFQER